MKTRTRHQAILSGCPGRWSAADLQAAQTIANHLHRPARHRGEKGDGPHLPERPGGCFAQMGTVPFFAPWQQRTPITPAERAAFGRTVRGHRESARDELGYPQNEPLGRQAQARIDRLAIRRACVECGLLTFTRRRITPPVTAQFASKISWAAQNYESGPDPDPTGMQFGIKYEYSSGMAGKYGVQDVSISITANNKAGKVLPAYATNGRIVDIWPAKAGKNGPTFTDSMNADLGGWPNNPLDPVAAGIRTNPNIGRFEIKYRGTWDFYTEKPKVTKTGNPAPVDWSPEMNIYKSMVISRVTVGGEEKGPSYNVKEVLPQGNKVYSFTWTSDIVFSWDSKANKWKKGDATMVFSIPGNPGLESRLAFSKKCTYVNGVINITQ
jgi:hypothetical protein